MILELNTEQKTIKIRDNFTLDELKTTLKDLNVEDWVVTFEPIVKPIVSYPYVTTAFPTPTTGSPMSPPFTFTAEAVTGATTTSKE